MSTPYFVTGIIRGTASDISVGDTNSSFRIQSLEFVPAYIFGDSYGQNPSQNADVGTLACDRTISRLALTKIANNAVAGTRMDQIASQIATSWTPNTRGIVFFADGVLNDVFQYGDTTGTATTAEAFRTSLAYLTSKSTPSYTDVGFLFGPGWAAGATSTATSYFDLGVGQDTAYLLLSFTSGSGGSLNLYNNGGALYKTINTGGFKQNFTGVVKISGLGGSGNTVRGIVSSGSVTVLGVAIPSPNPPTIIWYQSAPLGRNSGEDSRIAAYQQSCVPVLADFPTVIVSAPDSSWNHSTMIGTDGIHPNDLGNSYFSTLQINSLRGIGFRQGQNRLTQSAEPVYTSPTPSYLTPSATVPAAPTGLAATAGSQVNLTWVTPVDGGSTLTSQIIEYTISGQGTWSTFGSVSASTTSYTITSGLTQSTAYDFRIRGVNSIGTGAASATSTATAGAAIVTYAVDTFTRANSSSLGATETGGFSWALNNGSTSWSILNNQLTTTVGAVFANDCYIDDAQSNGTLSVKCINSPNNTGMVFRLSGTNNVNGYLVWSNSGTWTLSKRTGVNAYTVLGTSSGGASAAGDVVSAILNGSTISVKVNGTQVISVTDSTYTGTRHGMWTNSGAGGTFDNFSHTSATS